MADFVETIAFEVEDKGAISALKQLDDALGKVDDSFDDAKWSAEQAAKATDKLEKEASKAAKVLERQLAKEAREAARETAKLEREAKKTAATLERKLAGAARKAAKEIDDLNRQKIMGAKKGFESLGVSGEALANVYTLIGFGVGLLGAKLIDFVSGALSKAIAGNERAKKSQDDLQKSYDKFQAGLVDTLLGVDNVSDSMDDWSLAIDGITSLLGGSLGEGLIGRLLSFNDESDITGAIWDDVADFLIDAGRAARGLTSDLDALTAAQLKLNAARGTPGLELDQFGVQKGQFTDSVGHDTSRVDFQGAGLEPATGQPTALTARLDRDRREAARARRAGRRAGGGAKEGAQGDIFNVRTLEGDLAFFGDKFGGEKTKDQQFADDLAKGVEKMNAELEVAVSLGDDLNRAFADAAAESGLLESSLVDLAAGGFVVATNVGFGMIEMMAAGKSGMRDYVEFGLAQFGEFAQSLGKMWFFQGLASGNPAQAIAGLALAGVGAAMSGGSQRRGGGGGGSTSAGGGGAAADRAQNRAAFRRQSETDDRAVDQHFTLILDRDQVEAVAIRTNERAVRRRKIPSSRRGR